MFGMFSGAEQLDQVHINIQHWNFGLAPIFQEYNEGLMQGLASGIINWMGDMVRLHIFGEGLVL